MTNNLIERMKYLHLLRSFLHANIMQGVDSMYDCTGRLLVDPRNVAQRVMEVRSQIAKEWIEELKLVSEENALLMRETVLSSFTLKDIPVAEPDGGEGGQIPPHPEMMDAPDDSAAGSDD